MTICGSDVRVRRNDTLAARSGVAWLSPCPLGIGLSQPVDHHFFLCRKDLCATMNQPCETLGLSHVSGLCHPQLSCSVSEDTGMPLAFTVAHELGHR